MMRTLMHRTHNEMTEITMIGAFSLIENSFIKVRRPRPPTKFAGTKIELLPQTVNYLTASALVDNTTNLQIVHLL